METKNLGVCLLLLSVLCAAEVRKIGNTKRKDYRTVMEDVIKQRAKRQITVSPNTIKPGVVTLDPTKLKTVHYNKPKTTLAIIPVKRRSTSKDGRPTVNINANEVPVELKSANKVVPTNSHFVRMALIEQENNKLQKNRAALCEKPTMKNENDKSAVMKANEDNEVTSAPNLNLKKENIQQNKVKQPKLKKKPKLFYEEESEVLNRSEPLDKVSSKRKSEKFDEDSVITVKPSEVTSIVNDTHVINISKIPTRMAPSEKNEVKNEILLKTAPKISNDIKTVVNEPTVIDKPITENVTEAPTPTSRKIKEVNVKKDENKLVNVDIRQTTDDTTQDSAVSEFADSVLIRRYNEFKEKGPIFEEFPRNPQNDVFAFRNDYNDQAFIDNYDNNANIYNIDRNNFEVDLRNNYDKNSNDFFENVNCQDTQNSQPFIFNSPNLQNPLDKIWRTWEDIEIKFNNNNRNKNTNKSPVMYTNNYNPWINHKTVRYPYIFQNYS